MAKTWIKLYTEALHDRKMWKLKPIEQLAFWYLCILAGLEDNGGQLPDLDDIELELQMPLKLKRNELDSIVSRLLSIGLLDKKEDNVMTVVNFEKRQMSAQTEAEKKQAYRNRKRTEVGQMSETCPDTVRTDVREMSTVEEELRIKNIEEDKELIKRELKRETPPAPKTASEPKQKYGQFQNVLLTGSEYAKLCEQFPDADTRIENFSMSKAAKGYTYKSDYAAILTWARKDAAPKPAAAPKAQQPKKTYTFSEVLAMEGARQ